MIKPTIKRNIPKDIAKLSGGPESVVNIRTDVSLNIKEVRKLLQEVKELNGGGGKAVKVMEEDVVGAPARKVKVKETITTQKLDCRASIGTAANSVQRIHSRAHPQRHRHLSKDSR